MLAKRSYRLREDEAGKKKTDTVTLYCRLLEKLSVFMYLTSTKLFTSKTLQGLLIKRLHYLFYYKIHKELLSSQVIYLVDFPGGLKN